MMPYQLAKECCHVRSAIFRLSKPEIRYPKNHPVDFDDRVPLEDKAAHDWAAHERARELAARPQIDERERGGGGKRLKASAMEQSALSMGRR